MCYLRRFKINRLTKKIKSMQQSRLHNPPGEEALKKERADYHKLATIFKSLQGKKRYPFAHEMVLECYRASAVIDDSVAQYELGKSLLDEAKFRDDLQQKGIFANPSNERQAKQLFEEAHAYLLAAQTLGHIEAKRLQGLCYINGWGVPADKEQGFDLIVASIEHEKSWPQIIAAMGLDKQEFFSALTKYRSSNRV